MMRNLALQDAIPCLCPLGISVSGWQIRKVRVEGTGRKAGVKEFPASAEYESGIRRENCYYRTLEECRDTG